MNIYRIALSVAFVLNTGHMSGNQLVGPLPEKAAWLIKSIHESNEMLRFQRRFGPTRMLGRLLIYGPPGNGKSTIAAHIADLGDAKLFKIHGPSIVGRYVGQGAENIDILFKEAVTYADMQQQVAMIVIDEVDAIAGNNSTEFKTEHNAALQKLWLLLDDYKNDPRIYVVCTTNNVATLDRAFIDRFGSNCIEIEYPDAALREKVLQYYFEMHAQTQIDNDLLQELVGRTDGMSIRCLEDLARDASLAAYMTNDGNLTAPIIVKALYEIEKKWKAHGKDASYMSLATWRTVTALCNDLTHTTLNLCVLYGVYIAGSKSSSHI